MESCVSDCQVGKVVARMRLPVGFVDALTAADARATVTFTGDGIGVAGLDITSDRDPREQLSPRGHPAPDRYVDRIRSSTDADQVPVAARCQA